MADNVVKIRIETEDGELLKTTQILKAHRAEVNLAKEEYRAGRMSLEQYQGRLKELKGSLTAWNVSARDASVLLGTIGDYSRAAEAGFKGMGVGIAEIKQAIPGATAGIASLTQTIVPAREQLREFYREQRVQNRTFRELGGVAAGAGDSLKGFGANTGEAAVKLQGMLASFDTAEFALKGFTIAAQQAGGSMGKFGAAVAGNILPITIGIAAFLAIGDAVGKAKERLEAARVALVSARRAADLITAREDLKAISDEEEIVIARLKDARYQLAEVKQGRLQPGLARYSEADVLEGEAKLVELSGRRFKIIDDGNKAEKKAEDDSLARAKLLYDLKRITAAELLKAYDAEILRKAGTVESLGLEKERADLVTKLSGMTFEQASAEVELAKLRMASQEGTVSAYIATLAQAEKLAPLEKDRLKYAADRLKAEEEYKQTIIAEKGLFQINPADLGAGWYLPGAVIIPAGPQTQETGGLSGTVTPGKGIKGPQKDEGAEGGVFKGAGAGTLTGFSAAFNNGEKELNMFKQSFDQANSQMGQTIGMTIGQGFVDAFGIGHTLLGQFIRSFVQQLTNLASMGLLRGIFGSIPGVGSFLGIPGSVAAGGGVPNVGSAVQQMNESAMSSRSRGSQMVNVQLPPGGFVVKGTDLVYVADKARVLVRASQI